MLTIFTMSKEDGGRGAGERGGDEGSTETGI